MAEQENQLVVMDRQAQIEVQKNYTQARHVAGLCKDMAKATAVTISGRKYVPTPTWEAIATAHGFVVGTRDVEWVPPQEGMAGGFRCVAELKNVQTGQVIAQAEGFVGTDELQWFGGEKEMMNHQTRKMFTKTYEKRPDSAIRAMCQTRSAGRVCKQAFAHVVVLMDANLETVPLEEIDPENPPEPQAQADNGDAGAPIYDWRDVCIHMKWARKHGPGCDPEHPGGKQLGELSENALKYYQKEFNPPYDKSKTPVEDRRLRRALDMSAGKVPVDARDVESEVVPSADNAPD